MIAFGDTWSWDANAYDRVKDISNASLQPAHKGMDTMAEEEI